MAKILGISRQALEGSFGPATVSEVDALASLRATHQETGHRPDERAYLLWRYDFTGREGARTIWVVRHRGQIIGSLGVERDVFSYKGTDVVVHKLMDLLVREDHMGSGLGAWMDLRLQQVYENTLCMGSTRHSYSIVTKLNRRLPDWQTWRYPIRMRARHALLAALDPLLNVKRRLCKLLVRREVRLATCDSPMSGQEALRDSMSDHCIMPSRNVEKGAWRFGRHPGGGYHHYRLLHGERVISSVTVKKLERRAHISDALVSRSVGDGSARRSLFELLTLVIGALADSDIEVLSTRINDSFTASAFRRAGFIPRSEPCAMGCHFGDRTLAGWIEAGVPLFLMPADSDFD